MRSINNPVNLYEQFCQHGPLVTPPPRRRSKNPERRRLDPEARRADILDAAERRLVLVGPSGIRLQEVAADAGVSHPTVLHHFGSREALVQAVVARAIDAINAEIVRAIAAFQGEEAEVEQIIGGCVAGLLTNGRGRIILWLSLEGQEVTGQEFGLSRVVDALHAQRLAQLGPMDAPPPREDTAHLVVTLALALTASVVMGPALLENAGLGRGAAADRRLYAWISRFATEHFARR